jgi:hypothetical protein
VFGLALGWAYHALAQPTGGEPKGSVSA